MIQLLISSSILILVISLLRLLLRRKVSQRLIYGLWLLAALRLLIPIELGQSSYSLAALTAPAFQQVQQAVSQPISGPDQEVLYQQLVQEYISSQPASETSASVSPEIQTQLRQEAQAKSAPSHGQVLKMVWLTGTAMMALWFLTVNLVFYRRARKISVPWRKIGSIPIRICPFIPSPCLVGLLRPTICLTPDSLEDETALRHILAHETTHLRHGDPLWSLVRCLCLCVYWFHPLVWMAALLSKRDCELACDEGALERLGEEARIPYGKTLMGVVTHSRSPAHILDMATSMSDSKKQLKERMCMIVKKQKTLLTAATALVLICIFVTGCAFAGGSPSSTDPEPSEEPSGSATVPNTFPCMVMIDGTLYYDWSILDPNITIADEDILGHITSVVPLSQAPTKNDEANYAVENAPYALWNDPKYGQVYVIRFEGNYSQSWHILLSQGYEPGESSGSASVTAEDLAGKVYLYEKGGVGSSFSLSLMADGSFSYYEGLLSSYFGMGTWTLEDNILHLKDTGMSRVQDFYFRVENGQLVFLAESSDRFLYVDVADGERFISNPNISQQDHTQELAQRLQGYWVDLSDVQGPDPATGHYVYRLMWVTDTHIGFGISYTDARVDGTITEVKQLSDGKYELSYYVEAIGSPDSIAYPYQEAYTKTVIMEIGENTVTMISDSKDPVVYTYMCQDQGSLEDTLSHINSLLNDQNEA